MPSAPAVCRAARGTRPPTWSGAQTHSTPPCGSMPRPARGACGCQPSGRATASSCWTTPRRACATASACASRMSCSTQSLSQHAQACTSRACLSRHACTPCAARTQQAASTLTLLGPPIGGRLRRSWRMQLKHTMRLATAWIAPGVGGLCLLIAVYGLLLAPVRPGCQHCLATQRGPGLWACLLAPGHPGQHCCQHARLPGQDAAGLSITSAAAQHSSAAGVQGQARSHVHNQGVQRAQGHHDQAGAGTVQAPA